MLKPRKIVESIKNDFRKQIVSDAAQYKRSIIKEIELKFRQMKAANPDITLQDISKKVLKELKVDSSFISSIEAEIKAADKEISSIWNQYFTKVSRKEFVLADYEKLVSASKVNFNTIDIALNNTVQKEFMKAIKGDYSFNALVSSLKKRDIGDAQAYTMANTSISIFDNSYHTETAHQAGIDKFLYDGDESYNTRDFCLIHLGEIKTMDEWAALDNGQGLPVETSCGGFNCQHFYTAFIE